MSMPSISDFITFILYIFYLVFVTSIPNHIPKKQIYNIFHPFAFYQKAMNKRHDYMKHLYQYLRLFLWRILDAIDRKLGPGPGDHRP